MDARPTAARPGILSAIALVAGPVYAMLAGRRDRTVGWVLVSVGAATAAVDVLRLILFGPW